MTRDSVACPSCSAIVSIVTLHLMTESEGSRPVTGTVLKKCPNCQKWLWMSPQPQGAV